MIPMSVLGIVISTFLTFGDFSNELPWSNSRQVELKYSVEETLKSPGSDLYRYEFPIQTPEEILNTNGKVYIFTYGSLLNKDSAKRSLSKDAMDTYTPAIAFGVKRVFDRDVPKKFSEKWGPLSQNNETGMLNIVFDNDFGSIVNGALVEVDLKDLNGLISRETGYDLVSVPVVTWQDAKADGTPNVIIALTFHASENERDSKQYTSKCINPVKGYALASKEGARQYGDEFVKLFEETTYLADGKTSFKKWEQSGVTLPDNGCVKS